MPRFLPDSVPLMQIYPSQMPNTGRLLGQGIESAADKISAGIARGQARREYERKQFAEARNQLKTDMKIAQNYLSHHFSKEQEGSPEWMRASQLVGKLADGAAGIGIDDYEQANALHAEFEAHQAGILEKQRIQDRQALEQKRAFEQLQREHYWDDRQADSDLAQQAGERAAAISNYAKHRSGLTDADIMSALYPSLDSANQEPDRTAAMFGLASGFDGFNLLSRADQDAVIESSGKLIDNYIERQDAIKAEKLADARKRIAGFEGVTPLTQDDSDKLAELAYNTESMLSVINSMEAAERFYRGKTLGGKNLTDRDARILLSAMEQLRLEQIGPVRQLFKDSGNMSGSEREIFRRYVEGGRISIEDMETLWKDPELRTALRNSRRLQTKRSNRDMRLNIDFEGERPKSIIPFLENNYQEIVVGRLPDGTSIADFEDIRPWTEDDNFFIPEKREDQIRHRDRRLKAEGLTSDESVEDVDSQNENQALESASPESNRPAQEEEQLEDFEVPGELPLPDKVSIEDRILEMEERVKGLENLTVDQEEALDYAREFKQMGDLEKAEQYLKDVQTLEGLKGNQEAVPDAVDAVESVPQDLGYQMPSNQVRRLARASVVGQNAGFTPTSIPSHQNDVARAVQSAVLASPNEAHEPIPAAVGKDKQTVDSAVQQLVRGAAGGSLQSFPKAGTLASSLPSTATSAQFVPAQPSQPTQPSPELMMLNRAIAQSSGQTERPPGPWYHFSFDTPWGKIGGAERPGRVQQFLIDTAEGGARGLQKLPRRIFGIGGGLHRPTVDSKIKPTRDDVIAYLGDRESAGSGRVAGRRWSRKISGALNSLDNPNPLNAEEKNRLNYLMQLKSDLLDDKERAERKILNWRNLQIESGDLTAGEAVEGISAAASVIPVAAVAGMAARGVGLGAGATARGLGSVVGGVGRMVGGGSGRGKAAQFIQSKANQIAEKAKVAGDAIENATNAFKSARPKGGYNELEVPFGRNVAGNSGKIQRVDGRVEDLPGSKPQGSGWLRSGGSKGIDHAYDPSLTKAFRDWRHERLLRKEFGIYENPKNFFTKAWRAGSDKVRKAVSGRTKADVVADKASVSKLSQELRILRVAERNARERLQNFESPLIDSIRKGLTDVSKLKGSDKSSFERWSKASKEWAEARAQTAGMLDEIQKLGGRGFLARVKDQALAWLGPAAAGAAIFEGGRRAKNAIFGKDPAAGDRRNY